jgi:peptidoglycan/LPS O-acetylase OafA/YrhL
MKMGEFAVDLFFFLSAFLLTFGLYQTLDRGVVSWKHHLLILIKYFIRRVFRVYPLFFAVVCVLYFGPQNLRDAYWVPVQIDFFRVALFYEGYRHYVFWTLPVEIQYYFLIPVYVYLVFYTKKYWYVSNTLLLATSIYPSLYFYRTAPTNLDANIGTFLAGSAFGIYFFHLNRADFTRKYQLFWECISVLLAIVITSQASRNLFFDYIQIPFNGNYTYTSGFVGLLFLKELVYPGVVSSLMDWPVFAFCGKISFSVYLLHPIGISYAKDLKGQDKFFWSVIYTFGLGLFGYYLIEARVETFSRRICQSLDEYFKEKCDMETTQICQV